MHDDDAAPPPVVPAAAQHGEEARRGGRSRHDHSKREKQTKFGEYILGNTIGEGEFGKVKLGWKQEGGVQVCLDASVDHVSMSSADHKTPVSGSY